MERDNADFIKRNEVLMKVLKANQEQYELLNGFKNGVNQIEFSKDANDNWIISVETKDDPAFIGIHEALSDLEEIDYSPVTE
jgi:hypothetical protein